MHIPTPIRHARRVVVLAAAGLTAACSTQSYHATPAATSTAQACTLQCQDPNSQCRVREDSRMQQCEWRRQQVQRDLDNCKANNAEAAKCAQQLPLCDTANYGPCDAQYRQCAQACGGTISENPQK